MKVKEKFGDRLSLETCKAILNVAGENYSDEQILMIRDFLYTIVTIDYNRYLKMKANKTITLGIYLLV